MEAGLLPESHLNRMDWMYEWGNKPSQKDSEEYLLGKSVGV